MKRGLHISFQEEGQALVEFALAGMILMFITFGLFETARVVYTAAVIQAAAQEGARAGIVNAANVDTAVRNRLVAVDPNQITNITASTATISSRNVLRVQITYNYQFTTPLIGSLLGSNGAVVLRGDASMLVQ